MPLTRRKKSPSKTEMKKFLLFISGEKTRAKNLSMKYNYIQEEKMWERGNPEEGAGGNRYHDFPESLLPPPNPRRCVAHCMWWME